MRNKLQLAIGFLVISLVMLACGTSNDIQVNSPGSDSNDSAPKTTSTSQAGSARSNPAPVGSEVVVDDMAFKVLTTIRPADDLVSAGNMFNSTPEPDQEYVFVEVQVQCKKTIDEKCSLNPDFSIKIIGSDGVQYDPEMFISGVDGLISSTEFYGDAVISGYIPFIVKESDTGFVMVYEPLFGDSFYLSIQ